MDRAIETLLQQVNDALLALRRRPGSNLGALIDDLEHQIAHRLQRAVSAGEAEAAYEAARALFDQVAELPLPPTRLSPGMRAEILAAQVELLRATARLYHHLEPSR